MEVLLTYITTIATTAILGATKKATNWTDTRFGKLIKPIQPLVVLAAGLGIPKLLGALHLISQVDTAAVSSAFANAPAATVLSVAAAEIFARITKKPA